MTYQRNALTQAGEFLLKLHAEREREVKVFLRMGGADALAEAKVLVTEMQALSTAALAVADLLQRFTCICQKQPCGFCKPGMATWIGDL